MASSMMRASSAVKLAVASVSLAAMLSAGLRSQTWSFGAHEFVEHMAFDSATGMVVGCNSSVVDPFEIYEWDGSTWGLRFSIPNPESGMFIQQLVYVPTTGDLLLFSAQTLSAPLKVFAVSGGGVLQEVVTTGGPSRFENFEAEWFPPSQSVMITGGRTDSGPSQWTRMLDPVTHQWSQSPSVGPGYRIRHAMAYDALRQVMVLYGSTSYADDVWEFNGDYWVVNTPSPSSPRPAFLESPSACFDGEEVVVFGGLVDGTPVTVPEVVDSLWSWNGQRWIELFPPLTPGPRYESAMCFDEAARQIIMCGGRSFSATYQDTWVLHRIPRVESFGIGCSSATLSVVDGDLPDVNTDLELRLEGSVAVNPAWLLVGLTRQDPGIDLSVIGMPGCELLTSGTWVVPAQPNDSFSWRAALSLSAVLAGQNIYLQGVVPAQLVNPLGLLATNGLKVQVSN